MSALILGTPEDFRKPHCVLEGLNRLVGYDVIQSREVTELEIVADGIELGVRQQNGICRSISNHLLFNHGLIVVGPGQHSDQPHDREKKARSA